MKKVLDKIKSILVRSRVSLSKPDTGTFSIAQIEYLGKTANAEVIWPYGMGGRLPVDASFFRFNVEAMEENKAGIGTAPTIRVKVDEEGEVWFGNPLVKSIILFKSDNTIEAGKVSDTVRKLVDERFIALHNAHVHLDPVSGTTSTPTVQLTPGAQETTNFKAS
jgi:hypothetical protein